MNNQIFQMIFETVYPLLPVDWEKVIIRGMMASEGTEIRLYIRDSSHKYRDCFSSGADGDRIIQISEKLCGEIGKLRTPKEAWSGITIIINQNGEFKSDFDYSGDDLFNHSKEKEWETRYLV